MLYLIRCQNRIKVGFTDKPFDEYLQWLRCRIPFELVPLRTRPGTREEEQEFHRAHKEDLCGFGGREWYWDSLLGEAEEFLAMPDFTIPQNS